MSMFQEIFTFQENNSIDYILQKCRKRHSKGASSKLVLNKLYTSLYEYTQPLRDKRNISELRNFFKVTETAIIDGDADLKLFEQLEKDIINKRNERDILKLAIDLVIKFPLESTVGPWSSLTTIRRNFMERSNIDMTAQDLEMYLQSNLQDNVFCAIPNFWDCFFEKKDWTDQASRIWESYKKYEVAEENKRSRELKAKNTAKGVEEQKRLHNDKEEKILEEGMTESETWDWLTFFEENFLNQLNGRTTRSTKYPIVIEDKGAHLRGRYCRTNRTQRAQESTGTTQIDLLIKSIDIQDDDVDWENMNVGAEFTVSPSKSIRKKKFLQLSRCAREVYCAQPLRRFMHGFLMFKEEFELWVFDRSGAYSSGRMGIIDSKEIFVRALCSYLLMSDEELGRDMSILRKNGQSTANFTGSDSNSDQIFEIKPKPVIQSTTLVTRGTTCYKTKDKSTMIKYSWSRSADNAEVRFMKDALPLPGVVKYRASQLVYQTNSHLGNLDLSGADPWDLKADDHNVTYGSNYHAMTIPSLERNRFLFRIAMTPCGRKIDTCGSIFDFVAGIRDAIKAHQRLVDISILHGDISEGNIILKDPTTDDDSHSMLIDFDCSVRLKGNVAEDEELFLTGTVKFMAIERLKSAANSKPTIRRTYRHDLESFFYVFVVGCIEYEHVPKGTPPNLNEWCEGGIKTCYSSKYTDLSDLEMILDKFTPSFVGLKELAKNLRTILFRDGTFFATPEDRGSIYRRMIMAFEETIEDIRAGRITNSTFIARRYQTTSPAFIRRNLIRNLPVR
ncbi:BgTH12-04204 [Blumeria graminis f. sp. triticale]|uniref:BgTH12-04204 n=1 Tax=Blumeria graminis f. sp. triticale TaxID=1689686 RepID=A0A9W4CX32_BLUGR|nr:BgTH12-04204 [Blumeria graminis f. sp. triticale]